MSKSVRDVLTDFRKFQVGSVEINGKRKPVYCNAPVDEVDQALSDIRQVMPSVDDLVVCLNKYIKSAAGESLVSNREVATAIHELMMSKLQ